MTRQQWDAMTEQAKWDYVCLLESMVDAPMRDEEVNTVLEKEQANAKET